MHVYPTLVYAGTAGARVRRPMFAGQAALFEVRVDGETRVVRLTFDGPPGELVLPTAHPHGSLIAWEDDCVVCLEADGTLASVAFATGVRQPLRTLAPRPHAVVVTPEHVVWCSAATPTLAVDGEVWRWWRGTDRVERLGSHDAAKPQLAVRPVPFPYPPERIATDVVIAANHRLGLIDVEGIEWLVEADDDIRSLACIAEAMFYTTGSEVVHCDLDTERCERLLLLDAPGEALVASDDRVLVAHNCIPEDDDEEDDPMMDRPLANVIAIDLVDREPRCAGPLEDPSWVRGGMELAHGPHGALLVEDASTEDSIDRVTYLPYDWRTNNHYETVHVQRWLPDGRGGHVMIEHDDWWCGAATGELPPGVTARINEWLRGGTLEPTPRVPRARGWQVSIGENVWFGPHSEPTSSSSLYVAQLLLILSPHIPPLAMLRKL